eukprot:TRINITY_DN2781_c0_g1_i1.p1 TRINITY_DN2781_c0_g1~~TRINITY_DN2781_c0_g1_i1.p1  ORF type:complete len:347 (-),score=61.77 TRINITY_DN2781_c0_g1_i1:255-1295(-)
MLATSAFLLRRSAPTLRFAAIAPISARGLSTLTRTTLQSHTHIHSHSNTDNQRRGDLFRKSIGVGSLSTSVSRRFNATDAVVTETSYMPTALLEQTLNSIHTMSGMPYWMTIVGTTIALRTMLLPLAFKTMRNSAILGYLRPQIEVINQKMKDTMHDREASYKHSLEVQALFAKYDCNPFRSMIFPLVQAPIFITFFMTLRNMAESGNLDFANGGALWFTNLCLSDPYYALPVISSITFLTTVEVGADGMQTNEQVRKFMRFLAVAMVPMVGSFPTGVFMYWITSNCYSLLQVMLLKRKAVSRFLGIPQKEDLEAKQPPILAPVTYTQKPRPKSKATEASEQQTKA